MKRIWSCLLALLLLAGCGGEAQESAGEAPAEEAPAAGSYSLEMITEWAEYDPSADTIWCVLSHEGEGDPLEFGSEYRLEVRTDSGWEQVPFAEGTGWDDILYTLPAGESWAFPCVLSLFGCDFTEGTYRVVKEVAVLPGETEFTLPVEAEFTLAEGARISAETPYGFWPLEDVPEEAHPSELAEGGAVVFTEAGTENLDLAAEFLDKVSLGIPCQLRTVQDYYESWPMLIDVIYENDSFLWRMRTGGEITEKRFSYVVTDGTDVYLSNGADWESTEKYDSDKAFLLPAGSGSALVPKAQALMEAQTAGNITRYRLWSPSGEWCVRRSEGDDPLDLSLVSSKPGSGSGSQGLDLGELRAGITGIRNMVWQADDTLHLTCETLGEGIQIFVYDPETEELTPELCGYPKAE